MSGVRTELIERFLNPSGALAQFLETYNIAVTAVLAFVTIGVITLFFMNVVKLSAAGDNEMRRRMAINGILVCLVCLGFLGGIDTIYGILLSIIF